MSAVTFWYCLICYVYDEFALVMSHFSVKLFIDQCYLSNGQNRVDTFGLHQTPTSDVSGQILMVPGKRLMRHPDIGHTKVVELQGEHWALICWVVMRAWHGQRGMHHGSITPQIQFKNSHFLEEQQQNLHTLSCTVQNADLKWNFKKCSSVWIVSVSEVSRVEIQKAPSDLIRYKRRDILDKWTSNWRL